jgi:hypothetical protein
MVLYFEPLVAGAIGAASNMVHSKQQMVLLDQTKTVAECALQLVYATKEGGGNPKVSWIHAVSYTFLTYGLPNVTIMQLALLLCVKKVSCFNLG